MFKNSKAPFVPKSAFAKRRRGSKGFNRFTPSRTPLKSKLSHSNMKVCVRVRPPNEAENVAASRTVVNVMDSNVLVFDAPPEDRKEPTYFKGHALRDPTAKRNRDLTFGFDFVFGPEASNEDVFENTTKLLLNTFMEGTNCSVFAYGATGAGKTHTMLGKPDNPGIMLRTMVELYRRIDECREDTVCDLHITYLEVYNEAVRDLLNPENGALNIREDSGGVTVAGLSSHKIEDSDELFEKLAAGNKNRTQHSTDANAESSRSHAVFQVYLKQTSRVPDLTSDVLYSTLSLIDLAGSERATVTKNSGARTREGANIKRSLLSLGNCINALAEGKKGSHIPFRDSKLTRILKDSLGGFSKTVMIANVSASSLSFEDTYNTLKYADRAKKIKAELRQNKFRVDSHIHQYGVIAEAQRTEIEDLKRKLEEARLEVRLLRERPAEVINAAPQTDTVIKQMEELSQQLESLKTTNAILDCQNVDLTNEAVSNQKQFFNEAPRRSDLAKSCRASVIGSRDPDDLEREFKSRINKIKALTDELANLKKSNAGLETQLLESGNVDLPNEVLHHARTASGRRSGSEQLISGGNNSGGRLNGRFLSSGEKQGDNKSFDGYGSGREKLENPHYSHYEKMSRWCQDSLGEFKMSLDKMLQAYQLVNGDNQLSGKEREILLGNMFIELEAAYKRIVLTLGGPPLSGSIGVRTEREGNHVDEVSSNHYLSNATSMQSLRSGAMPPFMPMFPPAGGGDGNPADPAALLQQYSQMLVNMISAKMQK